jgi:hypothetical protein
MTASPRRILTVLFCSASCLFILTNEARAQSRETLTIRGQTQPLHVYGTRGGLPIIVSSGDGGWVHLGPHVAEVLAANGFFVVGFDVKTYLERFTSGGTTLRPEEEPGDFKVIANFAARGTARKPILIGVSEGAGLSVLAASDPSLKAQIAGRWRRSSRCSIARRSRRSSGLSRLRTIVSATTWRTLTSACSKPSAGLLETRQNEPAAF